MADESRLCSLCEKPLDTTGYPLWCKSCRTDKKRALKEAHEQMANGRGFAAGAEAMRRELLQSIARVHPGIGTNFHEVARWVRECPPPKVQG